MLSHSPTSQLRRGYLAGQKKGRKEGPPAASFAGEPAGRRDLYLCRLVIAVTVLSTVALRNWMPIVSGLQALMVLMIIVDLASKRLPLPIGKYTGVYSVFLGWCILSVFWATDPKSAISASMGIAQIVVLGTFVTAYVIAHDCAEFLFDCLAWSGVALVAVLVVVTPPSVWRESLQVVTDVSSDAYRLGYSVGYHPNALGRILAVCGLVWIHRVVASRRHRLIGVLAVACIFVVLVFTKSRLAILSFLVCAFLYLLIALRDRKWMIVVAPLLGFGLAGIVWAAMNVPELYELVGFRFAGMLGPSGSVDSSTQTRLQMTGIALELFSQHPIIGIGFNNFSYYYLYEYSGWAATYAHNTYAELLADLGLVGTILYYAIPIWTVVTLARRFWKKGAQSRELLAVLFIISASQLVVDYGSISYTNDFLQLMGMCLYGYATRFGGASQGFELRNNRRLRTSLAVRTPIGVEQDPLPISQPRVGARTTAG